MPDAIYEEVHDGEQNAQLHYPRAFRRMVWQDVLNQVNCKS